MPKDKHQASLKSHGEALWKKSNNGWTAFRRFIFAPNLLTFVISVVVGNAFGGTVKDLVTFISRLFYAIWRWLFTAGHPANFTATQNAFETFLDSTLTLIFIALAVFYTIQFINNWLIGNKEEMWGYDEAHVDMMNLQAIQKENNRLVAENNRLQGEVLTALQQQKEKDS
ncbi:MscL family protein [Leuconostocaceae bacterium ESL0958]|nr:MscL family protein [Leuconostocaceae bacterium ESL0958]